MPVDKWYVLQVVQAAQSFYLFTRWGRTGTVGQSKTVRFGTAAECTAEFAQKFKEKTGTDWGSKAKPVPGKYKLIVANTDALDADVIWQYWVDDGVDGKRTGWYNYDDAASKVVEGIYQENTRNLDLQVRCVQSGAFSYRVDFKTLTQVNLVHSAHKQRKIRRAHRSEVA